MLAVDPERLELLAEEARLMAALNQDGTNGGHAHTNGDPHSHFPAADLRRDLIKGINDT